MTKKPALLLAALCLPLSIFAAAPEASLKSLKGKVMVRTGGAVQPYEARPGDKLYSGDALQTGEGAVAHVVFNSGAAVLVKGNAALTVESGKGDTFLNFSVGEFLIGLKKKLAPGSKFQVKTPAAVAAVRGTLFWGLSDPETKDSTYACFENQIEIEAQGKTVLLEPGQKVKIPYGQAPETVQSAADIPADYVNTFALDGSLQGIDALMPAPAAPAQPETPAEAPAEPAPAETPQ